MKSIVPIFALSTIVISSWAQNNTFPTNGNVGIGVQNPINGLHLFGSPADIARGSIRFGYSGAEDAVISYGWNGVDQDAFKLRKYAHNSSSNPIDLLTINTNGHVGVGTSTPRAPLEIFDGYLLTKNLENTFGSSKTMIASAIKEANFVNFGVSIKSLTENPNYNTYGLQFFTMESYLTGQTEKLRILGNGNIGIGTISPQEKLSVNGKIRAHEIKVETANWPDYVFEDGYAIGTLDGLEAYIKQHKHLPEIPSAKEAETNGVALGEMNKLLLKKIEELTLLLIEEHKQRKSDAARIDQLEQKLNPKK